MLTVTNLIYMSVGKAADIGGANVAQILWFTLCVNFSLFQRRVGDILSHKKQVGSFFSSFVIDFVCRDVAILFCLCLVL